MVTLPCCGYKVDAAMDIEGGDLSAKPKDFTICLNCGAWLRFADDLTCDLFDAEDMLDLTDEQLFKMRRATKLIRERGLLKK